MKVSFAAQTSEKVSDVQISATWATADTVLYSLIYKVPCSIYYTL